MQFFLRGLTKPILRSIRGRSHGVNLPRLIAAQLRSKKFDQVHLAAALAAGASLSMGFNTIGCEARRPDPPPNGPPPPGGFCLPFSAVVIAGEHVFVAGQTPNTATAGQDITKQMYEVLVKLDKALTSVGVSKGDIVKVEGVVWDMADLPVVAKVYQEWIAGSAVLPAVSFHEAEGLCANGKVEIAVRACKLPKHSCLEGIDNTLVPSSACLRTGDLAFVSETVDVASECVGSDLMQVLRKVDIALAAAGMVRSDIVTAQVCVTDVAELETVKRIYGNWLGNTLPVTVYLQARALQHGARVSVCVLASQAPHSVGVNNGTSSATRSGDFAYAAAVAPSAPGTASQVEEVCKQIDAVLASVGMCKGHIVEARGVLKDIGDLMLMNPIYEKCFKGVDILPAKMVHATTLPLEAQFGLSVVASSVDKKGVKTLMGVRAE